MSYLTRKDAILAIKKMKSFHNDLENVMKRNGFNLTENSGRRNILLSGAQEKYFAEVISSSHSVKVDGRTGEPDIFIKDLNKELECKLTSPHKSGAISFQTDYETLVKKGHLDYLYVVADAHFEKFAVIHYNNLTIQDFRPLSTGARGKTQMKKYAAHDRANVLVGNLVDLNSIELKKLKKKMTKATTAAQKSKIQKSMKYWHESPTKFKVDMEEIHA